MARMVVHLHKLWESHMVSRLTQARTETFSILPV